MMSMVVEDLTGKAFPPPEMAAYAIACGARVSGGTNMATLCKAVAADYGISFGTGTTRQEALDAISGGCKVIANVGGDRAGYTGLFSTGGHYIYLRSAADLAAGSVIVWDPGYYKDKFSKAGRKGRVVVSGNDIRVSFDEIEADCYNRSPRYYILEGETEMTQDKFNEMANKWLESLGQKEASAWAKPELERAIKAGISDGTRPLGLMSRQEGAIMALRAREVNNA